MLSLESWLTTRGPAIAVALEAQRDSICDAVSAQFATEFPSLCYDPNRADAAAFQQHTFHETPRRLHQLLQVVLHFQMLAVVEREYHWARGILPRYGVTQLHLQTQVHWYFQSASAHITFDRDDSRALNALEAAILQIIEQTMAAANIPTEDQDEHSNRRPQRSAS